MRLIDADALMECINNIPSSMSVCLSMDECKGMKYMKEKAYMAVFQAPAIDAVPVKFIDEVIEYLTKCRDNAIHEEAKTAWDEQRQTIIMLLHEWAAWNECGRTGKYGERREG